MIAVVDYQKGNLKSVERGLLAAGADDVLVTADAAVIAHAEAVVLPGVGAFADAAETMRALGQTDAVRARVAAGVPFLGICLGLHLMFEEGTEGAPQEDDEASSNNARGLAILPGVVARMPRVDHAGTAFKVPHVGWNAIVPSACRPSGKALANADEPACSTGAHAGAADWRCPLFDGIPAGEYFYFTHSYLAPSGPFAVAETAHSVTFPSAVQYGKAAFGVQFHPEKSSDAGARVLRNFVEFAKGA